MLSCFGQNSSASTPSSDDASSVEEIRRVAEAMHKPRNTIFAPVDSKPFFDLPVTYNAKVKRWIQFFQTDGRKYFKTYLERSSRFLPAMQQQLAARHMPQDLAYIAMIESGFSPQATSHADAVGYWQFIESTASRYGLHVTWWLDERKDFTKSTVAASRYLADIYRMFDSWYLTAAAYNMGENRMRRFIERHGTRNFWALARMPDFPKETKEYIPKLLAAMLISKAPKLYGFHDIQRQDPYKFEYVTVPGGTDLMSLAHSIGVPLSSLSLLNPELVKGFVPPFIRSHRIRVPPGRTTQIAKYFEQ
jgi:membrane-bound lytic murein transglycosylase D